MSDSSKIEYLKNKCSRLEASINKTKADAVEQARLSLIIHSPARAGTFLDGADWCFNEVSKQLENYAKNLQVND